MNIILRITGAIIMALAVTPQLQGEQKGKRKTPPPTKRKAPEPGPSDDQHRTSAISFMNGVGWLNAAYYENGRMEYLVPQLLLPWDDNVARMQAYGFSSDQAGTTRCIITQTAPGSLVLDAGTKKDDLVIIRLLVTQPGIKSEFIANTAFGDGAVHILKGNVTFAGYEFNSDATDPLVFRVEYRTGYFYLNGKGSVKEPSGKVIALGNDRLFYVAGKPVGLVRGPGGVRVQGGGMLTERRSGGEDSSIPDPPEPAPSTELLRNPTNDDEWPGMDGELEGERFIHFQNPNDCQVKVGVRSNGKGKDFTLEPNSKRSADVPDGQYDIFFRYSSDQHALYHGNLTLKGDGTGVVLKIGKPFKRDSDSGNDK